MTTPTTGIRAKVFSQRQSDNKYRNIIKLYINRAFPNRWDNREY